MSQEDIEPKDESEVSDPILLHCVDQGGKIQDSSEHILDDILTVEKRYETSSIINQGGMKKILKTIDPLTNRPVAKATLIDHSNSRKVESFLREARLTAALEHPNIIPVYDIGYEEKEGPFFIMKLVGGRTLTSILKSLDAKEKNCDYSLRDLIVIFLKTCDAVAYAHSKGIAHLDLKPENIQVDDYGEVLVCDWGLARVLGEAEDEHQPAKEFGRPEDSQAYLEPCFKNDVTIDGVIVGTPGYMAPEQIDRDLGPKNQQTDIYALGGILYSILCLKVPFEGDTIEGVIKETLVGELLPPSERSNERLVPHSLEAVAMKALEIKPEWRYQTISEVRQEISKWMGGFATEAEGANFARSLWLLLKRHKAVSILLLFIFISSIAAVYKITQNEKKALVNERKALINEQKALDTLALYIKEKELTGLVSDHAIDQLKVIIDFYLGEVNFYKALQFIDKTIEFQPEDELLNALKGRIHFYRQEYKEALASFKKAGKHLKEPRYKLMLEMSPKYAELIKGKDFLKAADLFALSTKFNKNDRSFIINFETNKFSSKKEYNRFFGDPEKLPLLENHMELCRLIIIDKHKTKLSLNFKYSFEIDGISFDFSNSKRLDHLKAITHLPLKSLNLENTFFWRKWIFTHHYLRSVNIRNTNIQKMSYDLLHNTPLKEITLTKSQYDGSDIKAIIKKKIRFNVD